MKNKILFISLAVVLALSVGLIGCGGGEEAPTKISIGAVRSASGGLETIALFAFDPPMNYWYDSVKAPNGITVGTYGKLPVELTVQDDGSVLDDMKTYLTAMITSGDYDFVLPPVSTAFLQAAAGICNQYGYVLLGAEGGCTTIQESLDDYPYLFGTLTFSTWNQMEELFKILDDLQDGPAPTPIDVYMIYIDDLHGYEYRDAFEAEAANYVGQFNIVKKVAVAPFAATVATQLQEAYEWPTTHNGTDVELFCSFTYPPTSLVTISEASENGYDFDAMLVGPGGNFEFTLLPPGTAGVGLGAGNMTGVMSFGAWNEYSSDDARTFTEDMVDFNWLDMGRFAQDWWGALPYIAGLECLQQAIERAGELDNLMVRNELANAGFNTTAFDTLMGDVWFTQSDGSACGSGSGGLIAKECYVGQIGQWQHVTAANDWNPDGVTAAARAEPYGLAPGATEWWIYEVIDLGTYNTAPAIYPKQAFP